MADVGHVDPETPPVPFAPDRDGVVEVAGVLAVYRHGGKAAKILAPGDVGRAHFLGNALRLAEDRLGKLRGEIVLGDDRVRVERGIARLPQDAGDLSLGVPLGLRIGRNLGHDEIARPGAAHLPFSTKRSCVSRLFRGTTNPVLPGLLEPADDPGARPLEDADNPSFRPPIALGRLNPDDDLVAVHGSAHRPGVDVHVRLLLLLRTTNPYPSRWAMRRPVASDIFAARPKRPLPSLDDPPLPLELFEKTAKRALGRRGNAEGTLDLVEPEGTVLPAGEELEDLVLPGTDWGWDEPPLRDFRRRSAMTDEGPFGLGHEAAAWSVDCRRGPHQASPPLNDAAADDEGLSHAARRAEPDGEGGRREGPAGGVRRLDHRLVEQGGNDPAVDNPIIPLRLSPGLVVSLDRGRLGLDAKGDMKRARVRRPADEARLVGGSTERGRLLDRRGHRPYYTARPLFLQRFSRFPCRNITTHPHPPWQSSAWAPSRPSADPRPRLGRRSRPAGRASARSRASTRLPSPCGSRER